MNNEMTVVFKDMDIFPREMQMDGVAYKATRAAVGDSCERESRMSQALAQLIWQDDIEEERLIELGMTKEEVDSLEYDDYLIRETMK